MAPQCALCQSSNEKANVGRGCDYDEIENTRLPEAPSVFDPMIELVNTSDGTVMEIVIAAQNNNNNNNNQNNNNIHPGFGKKVVFILDCKECGEIVCRRGMLAVLVADGRTELFSTDKYDKGCVGIIPEVFIAKNCKCRIQNFGCLGCGSVVGYQVILPCTKCLSSVNNGHHCMFHSSAVSHSHRLHEDGGGFLLWKQLSTPEDDNLLSRECYR